MHDIRKAQQGKMMTSKEWKIDNPTEAIQQMLRWSSLLYFIVAAHAALASVVLIDNNK